jgi:RHS repeat-associated protein
MYSSNGKRQALYEYNLDASINKITIGDNIISTYAYDLDKNIAALKTSLGQEELASFDYSYDGNANMLTKVSLNQISSFEYDNLNRIVKAEYPAYSEEFFYDNAGNRARRVSQGLEELYQYDERNRLIQKTTRNVENGNDILGLNSNSGMNINTGVGINPTVNHTVNETIHYEYDDQGNLTKDNNITYNYDSFNRTVKAQTTSGNIQINRYDAEGLRHEVEENGKLVQFLYSGKEIIVEKTQDETMRYVRGYGILSTDSEKARTYYHYVSDEANSVTHVIDENSVLNKYEYDAFGNTTLCEENVHNPFRYRGQQFDSITNQYYLRVRYYNPVIARFTQEDTYHGDGLNLYAYCANNPVKYYDPSGYSKVDAHDKLDSNQQAQVDGSNNSQKKMTWNEFQHANKGKYTKSEMSEAWSDYKKSFDADIPKADVPNSSPSQGTSNPAKGSSKSNADFYVTPNGEVIPASKYKNDNNSVQHAVGSASQAQSVLDGINPKYFNNESRFGGGFYVGADSNTIVAELAEHGNQAKYAISYDANLGGQKVLDLTNSNTASQWGYVQNVTSTKACQNIGNAARSEGYNVIKFQSYRGSGINYVFYNNFEEILSPRIVTPVE